MKQVKLALIALCVFGSPSNAKENLQRRRKVLQVDETTEDRTPLLSSMWDMDETGNRGLRALVNHGMPISVATVDSSSHYDMSMSMSMPIPGFSKSAKSKAVKGGPKTSKAKSKHLEKKSMKSAKSMKKDLSKAYHYK